MASTTATTTPVPATGSSAAPSTAGVASSPPPPPPTSTTPSGSGSASTSATHVAAPAASSSGTSAPPVTVPAATPGGTGGGGGGATPSTTPTVLSPILYYGGDKHWLLIKEGVHIILDRILIKDNAHLLARCPLYGRLSRVEKRAAVLKFASALVQREELVRNVVVDTLGICIYEACETEARLESPAALEKRGGKARVPFMQKVVGEAFAELCGDDAAPADRDMAKTLIKQVASAATVTEAMSRMRSAWLSPHVVSFFNKLTESGPTKQPAIIYSPIIAALYGHDYFLPPIPVFTPDDERALVEAIRRDESEAGKETVFAANLKRALKLIRQSKNKAPGSVAAVPTALLGKEAPPGAGVYPIAADAILPPGPDGQLPRCNTFTTALGSGGAEAGGDAVAQGGLPSSSTGTPAIAFLPSSASLPRATALSVMAGDGVSLPPVTSAAGLAVSRAVSFAVGPEALAGVPSTAPSTGKPGSTTGGSSGAGFTNPAAAAHVDWWSDLRWVNRYLRVGPTCVLRNFFNPPPAAAGTLASPHPHWLPLWQSRRDTSDDDRWRVLALNAEETCDAIDHQPLWLSLRGMVGSNLFADGLWPITSNDGHLSVVRFRRNDRDRFWLVDPVTDVHILLTMFAGWVKTLHTGLRAELAAIGAAITEGVAEEVNKAIQRHLESAVVSLMVMKAVSHVIETEEVRAATRLGDLLVMEEAGGGRNRDRGGGSKGSAKGGGKRATTTTTAAPAPVAGGGASEHDEAGRTTAVPAPSTPVKGKKKGSGDAATPATPPRSGGDDHGADAALIAAITTLAPSLPLAPVPPPTSPADDEGGWEPVVKSRQRSAPLPAPTAITTGPLPGATAAPPSSGLHATAMPTPSPMRSGGSGGGAWMPPTAPPARSINGPAAAVRAASATALPLSPMKPGGGTMVGRPGPAVVAPVPGPAVGAVAAKAAATVPTASKPTATVATVAPGGSAKGAATPGPTVGGGVVTRGVTAPAAMPAAKPTTSQPAAAPSSAAGAPLPGGAKPGQELAAAASPSSVVPGSPILATSNAPPRPTAASAPVTEATPAMDRPLSPVFSAQAPSFLPSTMTGGAGGGVTLPAPLGATLLPSLPSTLLGLGTSTTTGGVGGSSGTPPPQGPATHLTSFHRSDLGAGGDSAGGATLAGLISPIKFGGGDDGGYASGMGMGTTTPAGQSLHSSSLAVPGSGDVVARLGLADFLGGGPGGGKDMSASPPRLPMGLDSAGNAMSNASTSVTTASSLRGSGIWGFTSVSGLPGSGLNGGGGSVSMSAPTTATSSMPSMSGTGLDVGGSAGSSGGGSGGPSTAGGGGGGSGGGLQAIWGGGLGLSIAAPQLSSAPDPGSLGLFPPSMHSQRLGSLSTMVSGSGSSDGGLEGNGMGVMAAPTSSLPHPMGGSALPFGHPGGGGDGTVHYGAAPAGGMLPFPMGMGGYGTPGGGGGGMADPLTSFLMANLAAAAAVGGGGVPSGGGLGLGLHGAAGGPGGGGGGGMNPYLPMAGMGMGVGGMGMGAPTWTSGMGGGGGFMSGPGGSDGGAMGGGGGTNPRR